MILNWAAPYGSSSCFGSRVWSTLHFSMAQCCSVPHIALGWESVLLHQENILWAHGNRFLWTEVEKRLPLTQGLGKFGFVCAGSSPRTPSHADTDCSEDQVGTIPRQGHLLNPHFLRHQSRLSESPWHRERGPGALKWGRLSSAHQTETDPSPRSPPVPQCALDWKKERIQDLQKQLHFQAVCEFDVLVPRGAKEEGTTRPINSYLKEVVTEVENFC